MSCANATLVFPCCVPEGTAYARAARQRSETVVAASSHTYDATAAHFDTWFTLPSIYDSDFVYQLNDAIAKFAISQIYCPVPTAFIALRQLGRAGRLTVPIVGEMPTDLHACKHKDLLEAARASHRFIGYATDGRSPLSPLEVAAAMRQAFEIFGMSDQAKITAMMAIFADAPPGDVIEIGVLAGRTACVLAMMAQRHDTGSVLAIDPWSAAAAVQRESTAEVQAMIDTWDTAVLFESFIVALLPVVAPNNFNYLAMPSHAAYRVWSADRSVTTPHFGRTDYAGRIAVLHIDGNHDFPVVSEDCALWLPHLTAGGWLILDDYVSFHCDGPRRAGNALLREHAAHVERTYVCGKALFVKLGGRSA